MAGETTSNSELVNELRSALTAIIGHCDMLEDTFSHEADAVARIKTIKAAALRMADRISRQPWPDANVPRKQTGNIETPTEQRNLSKSVQN